MSTLSPFPQAASPFAPQLFVTPSEAPQPVAFSITSPTPLSPQPVPAVAVPSVQQIQPLTHTESHSFVDSIPVITPVAAQPAPSTPQTLFPPAVAVFSGTQTHPSVPAPDTFTNQIPSAPIPPPAPPVSAPPVPPPVLAPTVPPTANTPTDLYRKYRPQSLADFHGQLAAVHSVSKWFSDPKNPCPQAILITGTSGVGKSTLARIIANMLGATTEFDYQEINIGEENGIDLIRSLSDRVQYRSHTGKNRVFFLDETALMRKPAQQALLKILEQLPPKIYIILATTDPQKLELTVRNRCVTLALKSLTPDALLASLNTVLAAEQRTLEQAVIERLIETAGGSGRQLMTTLQRILTSDKSAGQLAMLAESETPVEGELSKDIVWMLVGWRPLKPWTEFRSMLAQLDFNANSPESFRNYILSCCGTALLKSNNPSQIAQVIHVFRKPYHNNGDNVVIIADVFFAHSVWTSHHS